MLEAFQQGQDLHRLTASKISGIPMEQITKVQRQEAKAVNFLLIYGGRPELLKKRAKETYGVDMTLEEAGEAYSKFFETYPGIDAWHGQQKASRYSAKVFYSHTAEKGFYSLSLVYSKTVMGRKCVWAWFQGRTLATVNQLYNSPSQGTGADLLKAVLAEVYSSLPEDVKIVVSVHDEIVLEAPEAIAQEMAIKLRDIMRRTGSKMLAPVPVDVQP